jgi:hypothetical protein
MNLPDGTPILIDGVIAEVDDETGVISLDDRAREIIADVLDNDPRPTRTEQIAIIDLAEEVHRLIQAKHAAGVPVRSPLPKKLPGETPHEAAMQHSVNK